MIKVVFYWSDKHGFCYECGLPAAFYAPSMYGEGIGKPLTSEHKLCAVCAANKAAEGEHIIRIDQHERFQHEVSG